MRVCLSLVAMFWLIGCAHVAPTPDKLPAAVASVGSATGWGGMAPLGDGRYLIVHDNKAQEAGTRLSVFDPMTSRPQAVSLPVALVDWKHAQGISNDLESVCALEGRPGEVLAAESGYYKGQYGRIFHLRVRERVADVLGTYALPVDEAGSKPANYEGLVCDKQADGRTLLILGERGGDAPRPRGSLRIGWLDASLKNLQWDARSWPVYAHTEWPAPVRDISDLALELDGTLWAVATTDPGDEGPFRSAIWRVGKVDGSAAEPVKMAPSKIGWVLQGMKVEAIALPDARMPNVRLIMATDDENYGAAWRPLGEPETLKP